MLEELSVDNLLLIDHLHASFHCGLNVISGETGVGKSLFLSAIGGLFGERLVDSAVSDRDTRIEGRFTFPEVLVRRLEQEGVPDIDREVVIRLQRKSGGVLRSYLNGSIISRTELRRIGQGLVDVHGQRDLQRLLEEREQIESLDAFGGLSALRENYHQSYLALNAARRRFAERETRESALRDRLDLVQFQARELVDAALKPGEFERVAAAFRMAANRDNVLRSLQEARERLEGEAESTYEVLVRAARVLEKTGAEDDVLRLMSERAFELAEQVRELANDLDHEATSRELEDVNVEDLSNRLDLLNHLFRKHRCDEKGLIEKSRDLNLEAAKLAEELACFDDLEIEIQKLEKQTLELGRELAQRRDVAGKHLSARIEDELRELRMPQAKFALECGLENGDVRGEAGPLGYGHPRFRIQANPGAPFGDLAQAASGGELARVMLALKSTLAASHSVPILVFDEIETGVGPRLGMILGRRLAALSRHHQVFCITHLPQIAVFADRHFRIEKSVLDGVSRTVMQEVTGESRLRELAAMFGGGDECLSLKQAQSLLDEAKLNRPAGEEHA